MTSTDARARTPSVSELQAALLAARNGQFATMPSPSPDPAASAAEQSEAPTVVEDRTVAEPRPVSVARRVPSPPERAVTVSGAAHGVWLLATHGGSGARCLASVLTGTRPAGRDWPTPAAGREQVVLVCRSSQRGLTAAQDHARQFRDGALHDHLDLLGVIISADAPGRVPPALHRFTKLLSGAVPVLGEIPWQPSWRLAPPQPATEPEQWLTKLAQALTAAVPR